MGTIEQLLMTPASSYELLIAKIAPIFLLLALDIGLALGVARLVFGVPMRGSFVLLFPSRGEAYAGPGAGFAVLSSFWTIFVAFLYSLYALLTWPIRQFFRSFRRRKAYGKAQVKRIVIVGFDGMDPELATRFMEEGKLPNLTKLRHSGTFRPLHRCRSTP